jgi:hypothetical protein
MWGRGFILVLFGCGEYLVTKWSVGSEPLVLEISLLARERRVVFTSLFGLLEVDCG